ncbi:MAG TPA: exodeoxyribonuclease VII small subunit [Nevskiaceae bacterium]|nr:exodeoxyribonuclease VII small subunit [Nevskiaceae bacterium]
MPRRPADADAAAPGEPAIAQFEASLQELDGIVARLEGGELQLEEALALYERGLALSRHCRGALDRAELRLRQLSSEPGPT